MRDGTAGGETEVACDADVGGLLRGLQHPARGMPAAGQGVLGEAAQLRGLGQSGIDDDGRPAGAGADLLLLAEHRERRADGRPRDPELGGEASLGGEDRRGLAAGDVARLDGVAHLQGDPRRTHRAPPRSLSSPLIVDHRSGRGNRSAGPGLLMTWRSCENGRSCQTSGLPTLLPAASSPLASAAWPEPRPPASSTTTAASSARPAPPSATASSSSMRGRRPSARRCSRAGRS